MTERTAEHVTEPAAGGARPVSGRRIGLIVLVASMVGHVGNYAFYVVAARMVTPVEFAAISALIALNTIAIMPINGIQLAVARDVAVLRTSHTAADLSAYTRRLARRMAVVCAAVLVGLCALSPVLADVLNLESAWLLALAATWTAVLSALIVAVGLAQGGERFGHVAFALAGPLGLLRTLLLPVFVLLAGVAGGMWAMIAASAVGLAVLAPTVVQAARPAPSTSPLPLPSMTVTMLALLAFSSLTNVDVLVAQAALAEIERAHYAGAALLGKVALFAPSALAMVLLPRATAALERGESPDRAVLGTLGVTAACGLTVAAALWLMPTSLLTLMFGDEFAASKPLLAPLALVMTGAAVLWVHLTFATAKRSGVMTIAMVTAAVVHWGLLALLHDTPGQIVLATALTIGTMLIAVEVGSGNGAVRMMRRVARPAA